MEIICKCGYRGNQLIQTITEKPFKQLCEYTYSNLIDVVKTLDHDYNKTISWTCPKCGCLLAQDRHCSSYFKQSEMLRRLRSNSWNNEKWLRQVASLKEQYNKDFGNNPHAHITLEEYVKVKMGKHFTTKSLKHNLEFNKSEIVGSKS